MGDSSKIFGINKTGTTTIVNAISSLGIWVEEAEITEYYDDETLEIVAEKNTQKILNILIINLEKK